MADSEDLGGLGLAPLGGAEVGARLAEDLGGLGLAPLGGGLLVVGVAEDLGGWLPLGGALVESLRSEILWDLGPSNPYPRRLNAGSFVGADLG